MNNKEILEKAIQKAIDGGYHVFGNTKDYFLENYTIGKNLTTFRNPYYISPRDNIYAEYNIEVVIFNHDFAKALWGEHQIHQAFGSGWECLKCEDSRCDFEWEERADSCWEYHLQYMVISDDPIKYLGEHM